jgi:hypothetical protein
MLMIKTYISCWSLILLSCSWGIAQEHDNHKSIEHEFKHHRVAIIIGHGHVFGAEETNSGQSIATMPTWGIDYSYWINPKFGVGLKSDIEIMDYVVTIDEHTEVERSNPVIISTVFLYNPAKGWTFLAGPGIEFEENHNFFVVRAGMGYEFELPGHWDFAPEIVFDLKDGQIGSFTWGIGVGKRF